MGIDNSIRHKTSISPPGWISQRLISSHLRIACCIGDKTSQKHCIGIVLKIIAVKEEKLVGVVGVWQVGSCTAAVYWEASWTQVWNDFLHTFLDPIL